MSTTTSNETNGPSPSEFKSMVMESKSIIDNALQQNTMSESDRNTLLQNVHKLNAALEKATVDSDGNLHIPPEKGYAAYTHEQVVDWITRAREILRDVRCDNGLSKRSRYVLLQEVDSLLELTETCHMDSAGDLKSVKFRRNCEGTPTSYCPRQQRRFSAWEEFAKISDISTTK